MEDCFLAHAGKPAKEGGTADKSICQWGWGRPLQSPGGFENIHTSCFANKTANKSLLCTDSMMKAYLTEGKLKTTTVQITSKEGISRTSVFSILIFFSEITKYLPFSLPLHLPI